MKTFSGRFYQPHLELLFSYTPRSGLPCLFPPLPHTLQPWEQRLELQCLGGWESHFNCVRRVGTGASESGQMALRPSRRPLCQSFSTHLAGGSGGSGTLVVSTAQLQRWQPAGRLFGVPEAEAGWGAELGVPCLLEGSSCPLAWGLPFAVPRRSQPFIVTCGTGGPREPAACTGQHR